MRFVPLLAATLAISAAASAALAQDGPRLYGTIGYSENEGIGVAEARLGARFNRFVGAEVEAGGGVKSDQIDYLGSAVDLNIQYKVVGYLVGYVPVTDRLDLIARAGYGALRVKAKGGGGSASGDVDGWAYGLGVQYYFDDLNGLRLDYTRTDSDDLKADAWAVAYTRKF